MNIVIVGAGYVGLTTAACLARFDHAVTCVDIDTERVNRLKRAEIPIYEPGLDEAVRDGVARGKLIFSADLAEAVRDADAVFLAVGTPSQINGDIDLSFIEAAARQVAKALKPNAVVVIKSTVVAGTARWLREVIAEERAALDFSVASNPEFLREGSAIQDFLCPDRIVVGADDRRASALLEAIYEKLRAAGAPFISTTTTNAELIKYAANAFLALKIGFINDVADLCEQAGGDVGAVAQGIGLDRRIGSAFLSPGPGFGGSCFPKDTRAFAATARKYGAPQAMIETLIDRNEERKRALARRIMDEVGRGAKVAVLGVAFKADTDDVRESAALTIVPMLRKAGIAVSAHDPRAVRDQLQGVEWHDCPYEAAKNADAVVILTEWEDYRRLDIERLAGAMAGSLLMDFRNLLSPEQVARHRLRYVSLGRPPLGEVAAKAKARGSGKRVQRLAAVSSPA